MAALRKSALSLKSIRVFTPFSRSIHNFRSAEQEEHCFQHLPLSEIQPKRIIPLRGYLYLAGSQDPGMPQYAKGPRENFPYALRCHDASIYSLEDWGRATRDALDEYLSKYGAVLLRGLPINGHEDFVTFMNSTSYEFIQYPFGSDRREKTGDKTFGATFEASPTVMEMHSEGAYSPIKMQIIRKLAFFCRQPCQELYGGETPICRVSEITKLLKPAFLKKLKEKQLSYFRILANPKHNPLSNWMILTNSDTEEGVEKVLEGMGFNWKWNPNGSVVCFHTKPAYITHPDTGEEIMFNQLGIHHKSYADNVSSNTPSKNWEDQSAGSHVTYGDGEEIEDEYLQDYRNAQWNTGVAVQLQKRDILFMDNLDLQHGRLNYHGERKLFVTVTGN